MLKQYYGIRVLSATQPISDDEGGEFYEMFLEWNDEKYSKRLSKRVRNGLDTSVENGTFCGGYLIYGYKIRKEPIAGKRDKFIKYVEIDEEQAEIVRYVFTEYDKGVPKKEIADALNAQGKRLNGKKFTGKSFDKYIVNPKYTGEFYFGERLCTNTYPAIIDKASAKATCGKPLLCGRSGNGARSVFTHGKSVLRQMRNGYGCGRRHEQDGQKRTNTMLARKEKKANVPNTERKKKRLEFYVTQMVRDFLSDKENAEIAVRDTLKYYDKRMGADNIKSLETRIAKAHKDIEEMTTAFIEAKKRIVA